MGDTEVVGKGRDWEGGVKRFLDNEGEDQIAMDKKTWRTVIAVDPKYYRPAEVESLLGNAFKAKKQLKWEPEITFDELVTDMCKNEQ